MSQRTTYLGHHSPKTRQGITAARRPSGPVDFVIIEEREGIGAVRHQDGLEGVHLQDANGWVGSGLTSPGAPLPSSSSLYPAPSPLKQLRAAPTPASVLCLLSKYVLTSRGKSKTCGAVHPEKKLPENNLEADSASLLHL